MKVVVATLAALAALGCDETRVRTGVPEIATLENDAVRVHVSAAGIGRLVEVANEGGFPLVAPAEELAVAGAVVTMGPLEQTLSVSARMSTAATSSVELTTRMDQTSVFVPLRVSAGGATRVCRWRIDASRIETVASLVLVDGPDGQTFGVAAPPIVTVDVPTVVAINDCDDLTDLLPIDLDQRLVDYVASAAGASAVSSLPSSPLDILGLLRGNTRLGRISPFANREGTLIIEAAVSPRPGALAISADGLSIALDATAEAQRARCAPPLAIPTATTVGAQPIDPAVVQRFGADFGIAVSLNWLTRVSQGATLAGYTCRGLEDARRPEVNEELIPTADVLLEELGLGTVPVGPYATVVLAPGSLPEVELRPDTATIRVRWADVQVEVYGEVLGTRTRLARVVADAEFGLRPVTDVVGVAQFDVESIEVATDRVDSELFVAPPPTEDVDRWMQRTLFVLLEERFAFPLPLAPVAPVRTVAVQVRATDFVVFMRFD